MAWKKTHNAKYTGGLPPSMEGIHDFEHFANLKETWLRSFFTLPHGPPSDDTFRRIFTAHVRSIRPDLVDELIAIDGKALSHSFDHADPEVLESGKSIRAVE